MLRAGEIETANLMEWLAADMSALAQAVSLTVSSRALQRALLEAASAMTTLGVIGRMSAAGRAIASTVALDEGDFKNLATHTSDLVRQWAVYAINDASYRLSLAARLSATLEHASDHNMSVREAAWMAFRPHVAANLGSAIEALEIVAQHPDPNRRRFAAEVTRPRSVWGAHISELKRRPALAEDLLCHLAHDPSRYVQLAVGNWLNDASKTCPEWVIEIAIRWASAATTETKNILRRGLRTLRAIEVGPSAGLFRPKWPQSLKQLF